MKYKTVLQKNPLKSRLINNSIYSIAMLGLVSVSSNSFGAPVNCRDIIGSYPVYSGFAQCYTSGRWLSDHFFNSRSLRVTLSEYDFSDWQNYSCSTTIPFSHNVSYVAGQECDYTPAVSIKSSSVTKPAGSTAWRIDLEPVASDDDGTVVSFRWVVEGESLASNLSSGGVRYEFNSKPVTGDNLNVSVTAIDNDGYETEATKNISLFVASSDGLPSGAKVFEFNDPVTGNTPSNCSLSNVHGAGGGYTEYSKYQLICSSDSLHVEVVKTYNPNYGSSSCTFGALPSAGYRVSGSCSNWRVYKK